MPPDVIAQCLHEAKKSGSIISAYLCAYEKYDEAPRPEEQIALPPPPEPRLPGQRTPEPRLPRLKSSKFPEVKTSRLKPPRVAINWPTAAFLGILTAALLSLLSPWLALLALPALFVSYVVLGAIHAPVWREGDYVVAVAAKRTVRVKPYRVVAVFKDVHGMDPYEFANVVRAFVPLVHGVYYDGRDVYVFLPDGNLEEARAALRRLGVVLEDKPSPPPPVLTEKKTALKYTPLVILPLAISLASFTSFALIMFAAVFYVVFLARDAGTPARGRGLKTNDAIYALLKPEELHSIARVSQLTVGLALLIWTENRKFLHEITRWAMRQEHLGAILLSRIRMLEAEEVASIRYRILQRKETSFAVVGLVDGKPHAFSTGAPAEVDALTFDLVEFTPFSFMLMPFQCVEGTYKLGWDDKGREVCVNPFELESPHAIVIGKTGSGKTTWTKAQALQAARMGRLVVAIDPHGHWADIATHVIDARRYIPSIKFSAELGDEEFSDVDFILDVLRAAGVAVSDLHFTVLLNALEKAGGKADLVGLVKALERVRDPLSALAVDMIYGRIKAMAMAAPIAPPTSGVVVVTTYGSESPSAVMRLIAWLFAYAVWAKQTCPTPPCPPRLEIYIDEAHLLLRHLEALALAWRGLRKYGVRLVAMSQDVAEFGGPLSTIIANSDTKAVLAIDPSQLQNIAKAVQIDVSVLERVAGEFLPGERYGVVRFGGRAPIFIKLAQPADLAKKIDKSKE